MASEFETNGLGLEFSELPLKTTELALEFNELTLETSELTLEFNELTAETNELSLHLTSEEGIPLNLEVPPGADTDYGVPSKCGPPKAAATGMSRPHPRNTDSKTQRRIRV